MQSLDVNMDRIEELMNIMSDFVRDPDPIHAVYRQAIQIRHFYGNQAMVSISMRGLGPGQYRIMRLLHQEGVIHEGLTDTLYNPNAPICQGGFAGKLIAHGGPYISRNARIENDPAFGNQLAPYRFLLAFPVRNVDEVTNWVMFLNTDPHAFTQSDIELRIIMANVMGGLTMAKIALRDWREANAWIQREITEIASIQRGLLPLNLPRIKGLDLAAAYETFDRAGGDLYDVFPLGVESVHATPLHHRRWGFLIADATGHGPSAAVIVAMLSTLLRSYPHNPSGPAELLTYLNKHLASKRINQAFVTAFIGFLDCDSGAFSYARAGHPVPLLRRPNGAVTPLAREGGLPLGIAPSASYQNVDTRLEPGDAVLLYTDGIPEARSPDGAMFGEHALAESFSSINGSAHDSVNAIMARLRAHLAGTRPIDDQTILLARYGL